MPFDLISRASSRAPVVSRPCSFLSVRLLRGLRSLMGAHLRVCGRQAMLPAAVAAALCLSSPAGAQNLQDSNLELPGVWAGEGAWGDFDLDGDQDLALIGEIETADGNCQRITQILRNDGGLLVVDVAQLDRLRGVYFGDVGWADYDSDGDLDLAVAGWDEFGEESVRLYANDGETPDRLLTEATGQGEQPALKGVRYADLSWADMDNDGDLDLVVTGMEANGTSLTRLYRNTDGLLLLDEVNSEALINVHNGDLSWADVDNDGDLDLILSGENIIPRGGLRNVTEFYLNDPPGTLSLATNLALIDDDTGDPLAIRRGSLAWADYDEDGNIDLAVSGRDLGFNAVLKLYRNRPAGTLIEDSGFSVAEGQRVDGSLDWIDYDNDGDPDLAVTGRTVRSLHRALVFDNREGTVTGVSAENGLVGLSGGTALWADYSGDGRVDLLITGVDEAGKRQTTLYDNLGTPAANRDPDPPRNLNPPSVTGSRVSFSWAPGDDVESAALTYNIRIGTDEGLGDILSSSVTLGPGNAGFKTDFLLERLLPSSEYHWNVQSVDGGFARSDFLPFDGKFTIQQFVSSEQRLRDLKDASMAWADVDDDGDLDLAIMGTNRSGEAQALVYANNDGLLLLDEDAGIDPLRLGDVAWGDFDNDGDLDLAITGEDVFGNRSSQIYRTSAIGGDLSFALSADFGDSSLSLGSVDWGDADNDGDLDFVLTGQSNEVKGGVQVSKTQVWLNPGNEAPFTKAEAGVVGLNNGEARWGDSDADGDLDLALSGVDSGAQRQFRVYRNGGDGTLVDAELGLAGLDASDLAWGDFDRDGYLDLVAGGDSEAGLVTMVLRNDRAGGFEEPPNVSLPGIRVGDLAWGDVDNDQDLDLVLTGNGDSGALLALYRNTIVGSIGPTAPESAFELETIGVFRGVEFSAVSLVDIDGDGDLDLVSAGSDAGFAPTTVVNDNLAAQPDNPNRPPNPPGDLAHSDSAATLLVTWQPGTDNDEVLDGVPPPAESLTYNLRVGTTPEGGEVVSGVRRLGPGNTGHQLSRRLHNLDSGTYFWSVQTVDIGYAHSDWTAAREVVIDTVRPVVDAFAINAQRVGIGQTVTLALEFADEHSGIAAVDSVAPVVQAIIGGQTFAFEKLQFTGRTWSGALAISGETPSGLADISVTDLRDGKGNPLVRFDSTAAFLVDSELPGVVDSDPDDGEEDVSPSRAQLSITFSEPIDPESLGAGSFQIGIGTTSLSLAAVPSYDETANTVVLIPEGGLLPGTRYTVEVSAAIQDLAGNRPENAITFSFTTAIPRLTDTDPPDGSVDVTVAEDRIFAFFDAPLLTAALAGADAVQVLREGVRLTLGDEGAVFDGETNTLSFELEEGLAPGTQYEVILSGLLAGPLRAASDGDFSWRFSTSVPRLADVNPDSSAVGVSLSDLDEVVVTFSVPVGEGQLVASNFLLFREGEPLDLRSGDPVTREVSGVYGLAPADGWQVGSSYTVQISPSVTGPLGTSQPISWQFQTAVPGVQSPTPTDGDSSVSTEIPTLSVVFDNAVDEVALRATGGVRLLREGREIAIGEPAYNPETLTATFAPTEGLRAGTSYQAIISSAVAGPQAPGDFSWRFSTTVPQLEDVDPDSFAVSVSLDSLEEAAVTFSVPIDEDQLIGGNFLLLREGESVPLRSGDPVTRDASGVYGLAPADGWQVGSSYTVQVSPSVTGPLGTSQPISWQFQTAVPGVQSPTPTDGDSSVSTEIPTLSVVFDSAVDEAALRATGNVRLLREGREIAIGEPAYNPETLTATFAPTEGLRAGTSYQAIISSAVAGPQAPGDFSWRFSTTVPQLEDVDPDSFAVGVSLDDLDEAVVTFSVPIDDDQLIAGNFLLLREGEALALRGGDPQARDASGVYGLAPAAGWQVGSSYTVQISPVVTGPLGTSQPVSWQFQTAVPAIQSRTPAAGDADVSVLDPALRAVFDNAVDEAALRATGSVRLLREGDAVPIDEPVYNPDTRTLTFRPSGGLRAGAPYQVVIAAAVAGPRAAGDFRWGFATRVPAIASTVPPDGGVIPAGLRRLEVVFTNPVDADLVVGRNFSVTKGGEQLELADEFLYDIGTLTVSLPPIDFESGAAYEAVIRPQLLGSRSADRPPPQPWRFTTEIPAVIGSEPEAGAEGVALSTATIQILFSGRIASRDASGFQLASRSLADIGQDAGDIPFEEVQITGFGTNPSLSVVNFAPVGGFRPFTEYRVSVDREVLGELADADSSWVFSTAARIADPSQGETVSNAEGTLALFFPPNSLQGGNGEVAIRVADITGASVAGGKLVAQDGAVSLVGQAYEVDVGNAVVRKPVSLILSYTEADLGVRDPTRLGVFTLAGSELERVGGTADPAEKVVRTTVEELGIFALFEDLTVGLGSAAIQDIDCQPRAFTPLGGSLSSETDISFALTGPADVTVRVYNASGRLERVILRDTPMTPGRNSLPWDGRDEDEDIVASGLYIVVVSAGDEQAEKVVAVVR